MPSPNGVATHTVFPPTVDTAATVATATEAAEVAVVVDVAVDVVGVPMLAVLAVCDATLGCARDLAHEDRTVGEPPPRLALLISRRLRI